MKIAVVHNAMAPGERDPAALDVLVQARHVSQALADAGHTASLVPFGDDPGDLSARLKIFGADGVFNLVEAVRGRAELHPCAAAFWEMLGMPFTGSGSLALALTTDKVLAKRLMAAGGIPTPEWTVDKPDGAWRKVPGPWLVKPASEDASIGIEEDSVVRDPDTLDARIAALRERFPGPPILVERYIDGREFNLSVLASRNGPEVLPPAEIVFEGYPPGKERVVGYRAKWVEDSYEFHHTPRAFEFPPEDEPLLQTLRRTAQTCWEWFGLRGYARVDLRVDAAGNAYVLEVNANPCLAPDCGFAAAVERAGLTPAGMVERILEDALRTVAGTRSHPTGETV